MGDPLWFLGSLIFFHLSEFILAAIFNPELLECSCELTHRPSNKSLFMCVPQQAEIFDCSMPRQPPLCCCHGIGVS